MAGADTGRMSARSELSYERIAASLITTKAVAWLIIALLSILAGYYVLVWSELGFGLTGDYVKCLLWGFGLPTVGQQLLTMTPTSLRTSIVSSVPRGSSAPS
jgi:hypothetical protein